MVRVILIKSIFADKGLRGIVKQGSAVCSYYLKYGSSHFVNKTGLQHYLFKLYLEHYLGLGCLVLSLN